jgi:hypothetical protein
MFIETRILEDELDQILSLNSSTSNGTLVLSYKSDLFSERRSTSSSLLSLFE